MIPLVKKVPELTLLIAIIVGAYIVMGIFSQISHTETLTPGMAWWIVFASFVLSTIIAVVAVLGGVGGGVIFTPIMLGFTSMNYSRQAFQAMA